MKFTKHPCSCHLLIRRKVACVRYVAFDHVPGVVLHVAQIERPCRDPTRQMLKSDPRNLPGFVIQHHLNDLAFPVDAGVPVQYLN